MDRGKLWEERIITTENLEEDIKIEGELRPLSLREYVGQVKTKTDSGNLYKSSQRKGRTPGSCIILWSSRTGKNHPCRDYRQ